MVFRFYPWCVIAVVLVIAELPARGEVTWPQFRGVNSSGIADSSVAAPIDFGPDEKVLWSLKVPEGHSSPCIWQDDLFFTSYDSTQKLLEVWCIDRQLGQVKWRRQVPSKQIEKGHPAFSPASSTPATDGESVVAYFGSCGLICFDRQGNKRWTFSMPTAKTYGGNAISPIIWGDRVILYRGTYFDHFLLALSMETGELIWKKKCAGRFGPDKSCTGTPIRWEDQIVLHSSNGIASYQRDDGELVWSIKASTTATSTPILAEGKLFVATWNQTGEPELVPEQPEYELLLQKHDQDADQRLDKKELPKYLAVFHRPEGADAAQTKMPIMFRSLDRDRSGYVERAEWNRFRDQLGDRGDRIREHGLLSVQLNAKGKVADANVDVLERKAIPEVPSPIYHKRRIYMVKNGGILTCIDLVSGKRVYRKRMGATGTYYASPILCGDVLYLCSASGIVSTIDVSGDTPRQLARNDLAEPILATPAIVDGTLYVRTASQLYAFDTK